MGDTLSTIGRGATAVGTGGLSEAGLAIARNGGNGLGGKKQAPAPPNFGDLANQQTAANRPNQSNPFGSTSWDPTHSTQTTSFSGPLGDTATSLEKQFASANANPLDNGQQARQHAEDAIYSRQTARLDPMWQQRQQDANASLANQGLDPSSEAGGKALDVLNRGRNDAYSSAMNDAITGGGQEASRQQQMDLNSREAPLQQLGGLKSLLQMPGYGQAGDLLGAGGMQYGANNQQYNMNGGALGGYGQLMQSLGPLLQAFMKSQGGG